MMLVPTQELLPSPGDPCGEATSQAHEDGGLPWQLPGPPDADTTLFPDSFAASLAALNSQV